VKYFVDSFILFNVLAFVELWKIIIDNARNFEKNFI